MNRSKYLSQLKAKNVEVHINLLTDEEVKELLFPTNRWGKIRSSGATVNIFEKIDFSVSKPLKQSAIEDGGSSQVNNADSGTSQVHIADTGPSQANNADAGSSYVNNADAGSLKVNNVDAGSLKVNNKDAGSLKVNNKDAGSLKVNNVDAESSQVNNADAESSQVNNVDVASSQVNNADAGPYPQVNNADAGTSQVHIADAGPSPLNIADAGPSPLNIADAGPEVNNADSGSSQVNNADSGSSQVNNADSVSSQVNNVDVASYHANAGPSPVNIADPGPSLVNIADAGPSPVNNADAESSQVNNVDVASYQVNNADTRPSPVNIPDAGPSPVNIPDAGPSPVNIPDAGPSPVNIADAGSSQVNNADAGPSPVNIAYAGLSPVNIAGTGPIEVNIAGAGPQVNNADARSSQVNNADAGSSQVNNADAGSSQVNNVDVASYQVNTADTGPSPVNIPDAGPSPVNIPDAGPSPVNIADAGSSQVNNADAGPSPVNIAYAVPSPVNIADTGPIEVNIAGAGPQVNNEDARSSQVNNADARSSQVNNADAGSSHVNNADAGSSQVNNADAGSSQVNNADAGFSQLNNVDVASYQVNNADAGTSEVHVVDAGHSQVNIADAGPYPQVNNTDAGTSQVHIADAGPSQVNIADAGPQVNNADAESSQVNNADAESSQVNNADAGPFQVNIADAGPRVNNAGARSSQVNNADAGSFQVNNSDAESSSQVNNVNVAYSEVNNADAGPYPEVNIADAGTYQVNIADAGTYQVNIADAGTYQVNNADAGSSQVNIADAGPFPQVNIADVGPFPQVNIVDAGSSQVNNADAGSSPVNIADAGPSSQVNIADSGLSQVNIAETCTSLMKKSYKSNTSPQLNLASTLLSMGTSSISSAVYEEFSDSELANAFFEGFTIETSTIPCERSSLIDDRKDGRKRPCMIRLPAGSVPKKRKVDSTKSLGSDISVTHMVSFESAFTNIQSNCTTNTKLCGAENFTTDLEVKKDVGEWQPYQTSCSSSNSSQANFSELDRMLINESDIPSAESLTNISFNSMSENEPIEGMKIPEQGNNMSLDQKSIITSQEETATAEQKTRFQLELNHCIEHVSNEPKMDYTDIVGDTHDFRITEFHEVGNQNKEETESSSFTSELAEILNKNQGQETGETETLAKHFSDTSNRNLENAVPFPFYKENAVFTESDNCQLSAKSTCGSNQEHFSDSTSCIDHLLYASEHNWECQKNKDKEDVELSVTPNQNIEHNSINAHASYSCQFSGEHESGIPLFVDHYSEEQFDEHENISWSIDNVPNHNILEKQVENEKTNMWTCSINESTHENMEMDISCSDGVQKYLEDMSLNQPSEKSSFTSPYSQSSYDAKDEMHDKTITTFTSVPVHCDTFMNNGILDEGTSIKQMVLNQGDKIDPYENLVKDGINGIDSHLDNGNWFAGHVEKTLRTETTSEEHCMSFSENHNQAAFPYEFTQEQTENKPADVLSSLLAAPKHPNHGEINLSQNHSNQMPLVEECVEMPSQEKNISANVKGEQAVPKVIVLDRSDTFFYTLKNNASKKQLNCHVNDPEQFMDASNVNFDTPLSWLYPSH